MGTFFLFAIISMGSAADLAPRNFWSFLTQLAPLNSYQGQNCHPDIPFYPGPNGDEYGNAINYGLRYFTGIVEGTGEHCILEAMTAHVLPNIPLNGRVPHPLNDLTPKRFLRGGLILYITRTREPVELPPRNQACELMRDHRILNVEKFGDIRFVLTNHEGAIYDAFDDEITVTNPLYSVTIHFQNQQFLRADFTDRQGVKRSCVMPGA